MDHNTRTTTWNDPRKTTVHLRGAAVGIGQVPVDEATQKRLQRLELERQALQRRQRDLNRQNELKIQKLAKQQQQRSQENIMQQTQEMFMRQTLAEPNNPVVNAMDPFVSSTASMVQQQQQQQQQSEVHNRQESADSGIGMGSTFNLESIPEDLPEDMESAMEVSTDLDTTLTADSNPSSVNSTGTTVSNRTAAGAMDTSNNASTAPGGNSDSDQLIPSLGDVLSNDIMQDVLGANSRAGVLTWL